MAETKVKMLGSSVIGASGGSTMGINLGSNLSQWSRIQFRAVCLASSNYDQFGPMGLNLSGPSSLEITNYYNQNGSRWNQEYYSSTGTNYIKGSDLNGYSQSSLSIGRVWVMDLLNPGSYGKSGTDDQAFVMRYWTMTPEIVYSNGNFAGGFNAQGAARCIGPLYSVTLYTNQSRTLKVGSRMDAYAWANGT